MNISDFVAELESLGIELWCENERLCFRAPSGIMTETIKQQLRDHKTELLAYLPHETGEQAIVCDREARYEPFPLTETQQAWFVGRHGAYAYGGLPSRGFVDVNFERVLAPEVIEKALCQLIARHDMLRVVIEDEGYQQVLPQVPAFVLPVTDLRQAPPEERQHTLNELRDGMLAAPADYHRWPLFSAHIVRLSRGTRLLLTVELIAVDAASLYLLVDELGRLIFRPQTIPPVPDIGFRDYVIARRAALRSRRYRQDRLYWLEHLETMSDAPTLPLDEDAKQDAPFVRRQWHLSCTQREHLDQLACGHHVTLNVLLLGAFAQVLALYGQQRRFTLNLPIFRRDLMHADIERVVGDFTDLTLLDVDLGGQNLFLHQLQAISQRLCDAMDHSAYSGLDVLRELSRRRGEAVLMPMVFTSTLGYGGTRGGEGAGYHIARGLTQTPQVLIDCQVIAQQDGLLLAWDTREALFPTQLIEQAFDVFCGFISKLIEDGEACLHQTRPLTLPETLCAERRRVNATHWPCNAALLHQGIVNQAHERPDATALIDTDGALSYGQLLVEARSLAARLQHAGHKMREPVAVLCAKGRAQAVAPLAILLCGGCYVPIDLQQPERRRDAILRDAGIRWAVCDDDINLPLDIKAVCWRNRDLALPFTSVVIDTQQPAYIIYTSGSTGVPKGVVISHQAAWNTLADINHRFAIGPHDSMLAVANLSFDLSVYDLFGVLAAGGRLVYPEEQQKTNPAHWASLMQRYAISLWNSVPSQLQMLCDTEHALTQLRLVLVSGDWVPLTLAERLRSLSSSARLIALGGATEAAIWSVWYPLSDVSPHWKRVPYGTPLANQQLHILDDQLNDCPDWVAGQIAIAGDGLAEGYWQDDDKTAARFVSGKRGERLYLTGDRGRYWPNGVIEFLGRADEQVKIRGHRIELGEIAAVMRGHPSVSDSAAILTPEGILHGFAEIADGTQPAATMMLEAAQQCAMAAEQRIDAAAFIALMNATDRAAVLAMASQLRADGLFLTPDASHSLDEIYQATQVAHTHRRLLRRWLHGLVSIRALTHDTQGRYAELVPTDETHLREVWQQITQLEQRTGYGSQTLDYIRACSDDLGGLLRGERDVRSLLFPEGAMSTAQAAYRDNLVSRSLNAIVIAAVTQLAAQRAEPLRILEVGAGVAGTASDLVPALAEYRPHYWFTDLSTFFLTDARKRFADYPWMRYGLFDINKSETPEGVLPNSMDVILCANVLHNARHAGEVLSRFASLLAPGGIVVFIEPFRRHNYPLLVSMEFFPELCGFTDLRATTDQTFFTREQWLDLLQQSGATLTGCVPQAESALATSGQGVFIAQFNTNRASLSEVQLHHFLRERLPAPMVPSILHLLDRLPRSANGKIDRRQLLAEIPHTTTIPLTIQGDALLDDLEHDIAAVWSEVLDVAITTRDADFYACGGDSLLLSRMIGRLRHRVDAAAQLTWETLLRHLLQAPTLKALAALLRTAPRDTDAVVTHRSPVVTLWENEARHPHCCVLLHAGSGDLQPYHALLAELDRSSFPRGLGITLPSLPDFLAFPAAEALTTLAQRYTDALCQCGSHFTLIGYCMGGLLAAEVARQLTERGVFVRELVVISAWQPPRVEDERLVEFVFARAIGADVVSLGLPSEPALAAAVNYLLRDTPSCIPSGAFDRLPSSLSAVGEALTRWSRRPLNERFTMLQSALHGQGTYHPAANTEMTFADRYALFCHCMAAVGQHRPEPWTGKTVLVRNSASQPLLPGTANDVVDYWRPLCLGELIVTDTPGDHFSCLTREHAGALASRIARHTQMGGNR